MSSKGEDRIAATLTQLGINFKREYSISNLRGQHGFPYRFDFAIIDGFGDVAYFIEFDGEQHYKPISIFGGERGFSQIRYRDERKTTYCREHKIPLIRIPYWWNGEPNDLKMDSKYRVKQCGKI